MWGDAGPSVSCMECVVLGVYPLDNQGSLDDFWRGPGDDAPGGRPRVYAGVGCTSSVLCGSGIVVGGLDPACWALLLVWTT